MFLKKNLQLKGAIERSMLFDLYIPSNQKAQATIIFAHGFKGFKDWGHWHILAQHFCKAGFAFVKFNFSHNGTTLEQPLDFADLEAFSRNRFSYELEDLQTLIQELQTNSKLLALENYHAEDIYLIGHSRGGPIVLSTAAQEPSVKKVVTWASVSELDYFWKNRPEILPQWKEKGLHYILNGRTKQEMPIGYSLVEDFEANRSRLELAQFLPSMHKPMLFIHGTADPAVSYHSANQLYKLNPQFSTVTLIDQANHVFGGQHPFISQDLPTASQQLLKETIIFLK